MTGRDASSILPAPGASSKRLALLDILRGLAALTVVGYHLNGYLGGIAKPVVSAFQPGLPLLVCNSGPYSVSAFFVISGYLITHWIAARTDFFRRKSISAFYVNRAARLLPLMLVVWAVSILFFYFADRARPYAQIYRFPGALYDGWFWLSLPTFSFNWLAGLREWRVVSHALQWDIFWSLNVEEQFYFFYPLLILLCRRNLRLLTACMGVLLIAAPLIRGLIVQAGYHVSWMGMRTTFAAMDQVAAGCFAALLEHAGWGPRTLRARLLVFLAGIGLVLAALCGTNVEVPSFWAGGFTLISFGTAALVLGGVKFNLWEHPFWIPLRRIGEVSYGIYLFHPTMIYLLWSVGILLPFPAFLGGLWLACWGLAEMSYRFFETPLKKAINLRWAA